MKYQSKKDPNVFAAFDYEDETRKVTRLIYLTGDKAGYSFEITNSTLKMWWNKIETTPEQDAADIINTPYHPDVTPHYIPKPESVIEYENKKSGGNKRRCTFELPSDYEQFADMLVDAGVELKRVNKGYISLPDSSKLKILKVGIGVLATDELGEKFIMKGIKAKPCIEKGTPFRFDIVSENDYETMWEILKSL